MTSMISGTTAVGAVQRTHSLSGLAESIFAKLDTQQQGFLSVTDLESAAGGSTEAESLFQALDVDQDGKVSRSEFSDAVNKMSEALDSQMMASRMGPFPGPPPSDDAGFTKEQLSEIAVNTTDSKQAEGLNALLSSFDETDTNQDGRVTFDEAQAAREKTRASEQVSDPGAITNRVVAMLAAYLGTGMPGADQTQVDGVSIVC